MSGELFTVSRRSFLQSFGLVAGGLAIGVRPSFASPGGANEIAGTPTTWPALPHDGLRANPFVYLAPDGTVTIVCARAEMGQGVRSSLPVLIADELGADVAQVKVAQGDGDQAYGNQNTDGSSSVRGVFDDLRYAGAGARTMLIAVAARQWHVTPQSCTAYGHSVHHPPTRRSLPFSALVTRAAAEPIPAKKSITLRPRPELTHLGKRLPLIDGPDLVTGRAQFGADIRLPGMLTAILVRPPVVGGRVARCDEKLALAVAGVRQVVVLPVPKRPWKFQPLGGVAVVAEHTWAAWRGAHAIEPSIVWDDGENAAYDSDLYKEELTKTVDRPGQAVRTVGDVDRALADAARTIDATYHTPHLAHATMEPPCAVAQVSVTGDKVTGCEVWAATQNPQAARSEVATALGIPLEQVTVHLTFLGGGFGRKSKPDFVVEAALLARAARAPVRVQWRREDDIRHDYYHSTAAQKLTAALDSAGQITGWRHRISFPPIPSIMNGSSTPSDGELQQGVTDLPLTVPNIRVERGDAKALTRIGWMRSVANVYHAFAVQSFIDELAHARQMDPLELHLDLLGPPRHVTTAELGVAKLPNYGAPLSEHPIDIARFRDVLARVATASRWSRRKSDGRSLGLAVHRSFLTYVAAVASVARDGDRLRVDEMWVCADAGTIVNEDRVRSQLEGAVIFGLSGALYGAITMKRGATVEGNFRAFRIARMSQAPRRIHVEIVRSDGPPGGVGEPGVPPIAPAIANAVFALTGTRVRELPIARTIPLV